MRWGWGKALDEWLVGERVVGELFLGGRQRVLPFAVGVFEFVNGGDEVFGEDPPGGVEGEYVGEVVEGWRIEVVERDGSVLLLCDHGEEEDRFHVLVEGEPVGEVLEPVGRHDLWGEACGELDGGPEEQDRSGDFVGDRALAGELFEVDPEQDAGEPFAGGRDGFLSFAVGDLSRRTGGFGGALLVDEEGVLVAEAEECVAVGA